MAIVNTIWQNVVSFVGGRGGACVSVRWKHFIAEVEEENALDIDAYAHYALPRKTKFSFSLNSRPVRREWDGRG